MLILCVGMYRACSTWQYGVVGELIERHRGGQRLGFVGGDRFISEVEPKLDESRWSVLKSHGSHPRYTERLSRGQGLGIYSHRDLRDVAFSMMHKLGVGFDELLKRGILDQCLRNDQIWRGQAGMLHQTYEDLIAEPARGVAEIARHLGIELEPGEDRAVADLLSLEENRKRTRKIAERLEADGIRLDPKDQDKADPKTLLHWNHVREGRAGSWRDQASPEQVQTLMRICGAWLVEMGYEPAPGRPGLAASKPGPVVEAGPRISYARNMGDALLDRLFREAKGTYLDLGADHPTVDNMTYALFARGWRGVNLVPPGPAFGLYADRRPCDLNLELDASRAVSALVDEHGLAAPDVFSILAEGREEQVVRGVPLATWRPKVVIVGSAGTGGAPEHAVAWEPILLEHGYLRAAYDGLNRFYLRRDLADSLHLFDRPVDGRDGFVRAEESDQRERADLLQGLLDRERRGHEEMAITLAEEHSQLSMLNARFSAELEARHRDYLAWLDEREGWQRERQAVEDERAASQHQLAQAQAELAAAQAELGAAYAELGAAQAELSAALARFCELQSRLLAALAERDALRLERDHLTGRALESEGQRVALAREVDSLHGVIGRLQREAQDREVELDRARTQLGPYLKIDRLGVVSAIQRRVHAHRAHPQS